MLPSLAQLLGGQSPLMGQPGQGNPYIPPAAAMQPAAAPGTPQRGLSGFVDRFLHPTNAVGQLGKYISQASPGSLFGGVFNAADADAQSQQKQMYERQKYALDLAKANQPEYRTVGNDVVAIPQGGGAPTVAYSGKPTPTNTERTYEFYQQLDAQNGGKTNYARDYAVNGTAGPLQAVDTIGPNGETLRSYMRPGQLTGASPTGVPGSLAPPLAPESTPPVGGVSRDKLRPLFLDQESSGNYGAVNKSTGALGGYQVMPDTGEALAKRLNMPWQPDLMTDTSPQGRQYQDNIGGAAIDEALGALGGDLRTAFQYYFGGPNRSKWGPKTRRYGDEMMTRLGGGNPRASKPVTRSIGGRTFYQVNGEWYDNPEGK